MRVLLYVEPHPIRNSLTHFDGVAKEWLPLLACGHGLDIRMFANNKVFETLGESAIAPYKKQLLRTTAEEENLFNSHMLPWNPDGIPVWLDLMAGRGAVTEDYLEVLRRIWRAFPFEIIIHWGENGAVARFLDERPVTRIAMELGCTRPPFLDSVVMDLFGTNGSGVVPRLSINDVRQIVDDRPMSRDEALMAYSENLETLGYEQQFQPLPSDLNSVLHSAKRIAFLPLQLFDDANLLRFSKYRTVSDVVLDAVPKLAEYNYTTIIKPHPASRHRQNANLANTIARRALREWSGKFIWCDHPDPVPNAPIIAAADLVVTVNSSIGFESLYFDKPVVVLGDAVYKPRDLFPSLDEFVSGDFDRESYLKGIGCLRRFMLGGYLQPKRIHRDVSAFGSRISQIDYLHRQFPGDPLAFARALWSSTAPRQQGFARSAMFWGLSISGQSEFGRPPASVAAAQKQEQHLSSIGYRPLVRRLLDYSGTDSIAAFSEWLDLIWETEEDRTNAIMIGELVDVDYYLQKYPDVAMANIDPISHFCRYGLHEGREPRATIAAATPEQTLDFLKQAAADLLTQKPLQAEYPLTEEEEQTRRSQLESVRAALGGRRNRVAVVAHLYYRDLVPGLLERLKTIPEDFDLLVTLPDWGTRQIKEMVRTAFPDALFYHAANRGRDIGPFVDVLPLIQEQGYDAVLKIQTKRGYYQAGRLIPEFGDLWREETFDALLGGCARVSDILAAFRADPGLGMIGPSPYFLDLLDYPYHDQGYLAEVLLNDTETAGFFAGTMFWFRPNCLDPLAGDGKLSITSFAAETGANDGALAHLVERMFGHAVISRGSKIAGAPVDPEAALDFDPKPLKVRIHDYIEQSLKERRERQKSKPAGALAW